VLKKFILGHAIADPLPVGMHRSEVAEFFKSNELHRNRLDLNRRSFIICAPASLFYVTTAAAFPDLVNVIVKDPEILNDVIEVGKWLWGRYIADNEDKPRRQCGGTLLVIYNNNNDNVESSTSYSICVPRGTITSIRFNHGPRPRTAGEKSFEVQSAENSASIDFSVVEV
jgi:hypothetical protein